MRRFYVTKRALPCPRPEWVRGSPRTEERPSFSCTVKERQGAKQVRAEVDGGAGRLLEVDAQSHGPQEAPGAAPQAGHRTDPQGSGPGLGLYGGRGAT